MSKMGPGCFFELSAGQKITSKVYCEQILLGPLKTFAEESCSDIQQPIVMEDNAPVHKGACVKPRMDLKWPPYEHPPNSLDLNLIENI